MILHRARPSGLPSNSQVDKLSRRSWHICNQAGSARELRCSFGHAMFLTGSANASQLYISGGGRLLLVGVGLGRQILFRIERPKNRRSASKAADGAPGELAVDLNEKQAASIKVGKVGSATFRFGAAGGRQYRLQPKYVDAGLYAISGPNHQRLSQYRRQGGEGSSSLHHRQSRSAQRRNRR